MICDGVSKLCSPHVVRGVGRAKSIALRPMYTSLYNVILPLPRPSTPTIATNTTCNCQLLTFLASPDRQTYSYSIRYHHISKMDAPDRSFKFSSPLRPGASQPPIGTPDEPTLYTIGVHILTAWYVPLVHATGVRWKPPGRWRVVNSARHSVAPPPQRSP